MASIWSGMGTGLRATARAVGFLAPKPPPKPAAKPQAASAPGSGDALAPPLRVAGPGDAPGAAPGPTPKSPESPKAAPPVGRFTLLPVHKNGPVMVQSMATNSRALLVTVDADAATGTPERSYVVNMGRDVHGLSDDRFEDLAGCIGDFVRFAAERGGQEFSRLSVSPKTVDGKLLVGATVSGRQGEAYYGADAMGRERDNEAAKRDAQLLGAYWERLNKIVTADGAELVIKPQRAARVVAPGGDGAAEEAARREAERRRAADSGKGS